MPETATRAPAAGFPSFTIPAELAKIAERAFMLGDRTLDAQARAEAHRLGFSVLGAAVDLMRAETERADREAAAKVSTVAIGVPPAGSAFGMTRVRS